MGYHLYITRRGFWGDPGGPAITESEWSDYVQGDRQLIGDAGNLKHATIVEIASEHEDPWLAFADGNIYTKNPDEPILAKMLEIAAALNGKVQGDDGEIYTRPDFEKFSEGNASD